MQNVMLGLTAHGLGGCPQFSVAAYADIIRQTLVLPPDRWIVSGLALGWPDIETKVNTYVPDRLSLPDFVEWSS
jgi:nitroreductase